MSLLPSRVRRVLHPVSPLTLLMLCAGVFNSGCFVTPLPPIDYPIDATRLIATADQSLQLCIEVDSPDSSSGHQYLFLALPMTRVRAPLLREALLSQLTLEGAMRGYRLIAIDTLAIETPSTLPTLRIQVTDRSINGYDLLFARRPSASVSMQGTILANGSESAIVRSCSVQGEHSSFEPFAFERELNRALQLALEDAAQKLFNCLRM